jgi:serpin B
MKKNQIITLIVVLIIISAIFYLAFQYSPDENLSEENKISGNNTPTAVGNFSFNDAVNSFAFDFIKELNNNDNIFISPYSIFTALAMTYEGARGITAEEMKSLLNIEQDNESFHKYMEDLYELLNKENNDYNISTANALWVKDDYQLLETYLNVIRNYYGGNATEVDFSKSEEAANIINKWVENNTNGLIEDLILPDYITIMTVLILTNAIYFKGNWEVQFDQVNTTDREFTEPSGETIEVPTMSLVETNNYFNYTETDDLQILELKYSGNDISMLILLPKDKGLSAIIDNIDADSFSELRESMVENNVDIYLPKFKVETEYQLNDYLIDLGMVTPFTTSADFSGMNGYKELFISRVVHKAFIEVNEEGTEAAAATAVIMERLSIEPEKIVFDCNHPFMYLIQHKQTGTILFMGTINNPLD